MSRRSVEDGAEADADDVPVKRIQNCFVLLLSLDNRNDAFVSVEIRHFVIFVSIV